MKHEKTGSYRPSVGLLIQHPIHCDLILTGLRVPRVGWAEDPAWAAGPNWQTPQGGRDPGEDVHTAAWRELLEETGMGPRNVTFVRILPGVTHYDWLNPDFRRDGYRGQEHTWVLFRKHTTDLPDLNLATDKEFLRMAWMTMDELLTQCQDFRKPGYRLVRELLLS